MPKSNTYNKTDYPANGWSNSFGGSRFHPYPWGLPYSLVVTVPGSTGFFSPLTRGVRLTAVNTQLRGECAYVSNVIFGFSDVPFTAAINTRTTSLIDTSFIFGIFLVVIPFVIGSFNPILWPNPRKIFNVPGPDLYPIPFIPRVGPTVFCKPWNKRGASLYP